MVNTTVNDFDWRCQRLGPWISETLGRASSLNQRGKHGSERFWRCSLREPSTCQTGTRLSSVNTQTAWAGRWTTVTLRSHRTSLRSIAAWVGPHPWLSWWRRASWATSRGLTLTRSIPSDCVVESGVWREKEGAKAREIERIRTWKVLFY